MIRKYQNGQVIGLGSNPLSSILPQLQTDFNSNLQNVTTEINGITPDLAPKKGPNWGNIMGYASMATDLIGGFMPEKDEYQGTYGDITQTMDSVWDTTADTLMSIPGWGTITGGAMKVAGVLGDAVGALGGSTDGMTKVDAILGSSFLNLTPFGLINGFGGKNADTITKNQLAFEQVGASYGGTSATVDDALTKSGKKYGLFSNKARKEANAEIAEAKRQQNIMTNIADTATDRNNLAQSMAAINENRRAFQLQGGYQQGNVRVGKHGMNIDLINRAKQILSYTEIEPISPQLLSKFKDGGRISKKIRDYYKDYNLDGITIINDSSPRTENDTIYSPSDEFTVHELWHYISQNKPNEALKEFYDSLNDNKLLQFGADLDFVKRTGDPSDFYNPSELEARLKAAKFMSQGQNYTKDFFKNLRSNENQYGDNMRDLLRMFNDDYLEKLFNINSAQKFQEGGSINVIPDGALHARKHNMDMEGITKKGIPVVSETKDGEIEQQAEIEREEVILRLEVTQKLEELEKKFYSEESTQEEKDECALEAGKLLVEEILYNTDDKANLINRV